MRNIRIGLFLSLIAVLFISCGGEKKGGGTADSTVVQHADTSAFGKTLAALNGEINENPQNADLYFQRANLFLKNKSFAEANTDITHALSIDSTKAEYYIVLADIMFANFKLKNASDLLEKSLTLDPQNLNANLKLAELYLYLKAYPKVYQYADAALKIDKHAAKAYFIKGFAFKENGDTASAVSSFQTVVEQDPQNFDAFMQLGILFEAKRSKLAIEYYNSALRLKPNDLFALYDRSNCYQNLGDYNKAIEGYYTILSIDSNYADAHYNLGYIHLVYLHVYDQAIKHFTGAIKAKPDYHEAWYNRGLCYENVGNVAAAKQDYEQALKLKPDYDMAKKGLARVQGLTP